MPPGNLYYIAGSFGKPEIVKVVSDQEVLVVLRTVVGFYLFMNYVLLSQKSHVEFFLVHMLSLGVTLPLPSLEMAKS